jgi:tetratricopeptide (TPR) repeat protein
VIGFLFVAGLTAIIGHWYWQRPAVPDLPVVALDGLEPAVAQAVEAAWAAARQAPRSAAAWGHLGMVLRAHFFNNEASVCFTAAEKLDRRDPRWPYLNALTLMVEQRDPAVVVAHLERAAARSDEVLAPRSLLGEMLLAEGRLVEAERHFRQVLQRDPHDARAHLGMGRVKHAQDDLEGALGHLQKSVEREPNVRATHALLAEIYNRLGDRTAADSEMRLLATLPEEFSWRDPYLTGVRELQVGLRGQIARITDLLGQRRGREALELAQRTVHQYPESQVAQQLLGRLYLQRGDVDRAVPPLREAARLKPDSEETQQELGVALYRQGYAEEAVECFRKAIALKPESAQAHFNLALCLESQGRRGDAIGTLRDAVRYKPDLGAAQRALGQLLLEDGQRAAAVVHLEHAVRLLPRDEAAKSLLAAAQRLNGSAER